MAQEPIDRLRRICLSLPEVTERLSHGEPSWFVGKPQFVTYADRHHDDKIAFWCAAPPGAQETLADADPGQFFRPPYVGGRGWLGVRVDNGPDWALVADLVRDAYCEVAPARLVALIGPDA